MFRRSLNRAVLRLRLTTETPLLIQSGDSGLDPGVPDLNCVRTGVGKERTVYIPGSSLKGVVRSAAESSVRGRRWGGVMGACDPLSHSACGAGSDRRDQVGTAVHASHCLACRTFGSTAMAGRVAIRDLFPWDPSADHTTREKTMDAANATGIRHGVAINRVSGSVEHGPFELETVPVGAVFWGEVTLLNYQAWQLGLLAAGLEEMNDGFAQLGSNKSRGLGVVQIEVASILHEQAGAGTAAGVGRLGGAEHSRAYGLLPDRELGPGTGVRRGLSWRHTVEGEAVVAWLEAGLEALGALEES